MYQPKLQELLELPLPPLPLLQKTYMMVSELPFAMAHLEVEVAVEVAEEVEACLPDNQQPNPLHQDWWQLLAMSKTWDSFHLSLMAIEPKQMTSLTKSKATSSSIKT